MKETSRYHIKYPAGSDLVRNASAQFEAMAESIDDNIDTLPDVITQKVDTATRTAQQAAADAQKYSATTQQLQDAAVSTLIGDGASKTQSALYKALPRTDAVQLGVDNTNVKDAGAQINDIMSKPGHPNALYFPPGNYRIVTPIKANGWIIDASPAANFNVDSGIAIDCIVEVTNAGAGNRIFGGRWNANKSARSCVKSAVNNTLYIRGGTFTGATETCLDLAGGHGEVVTDVAVYGGETDTTAIAGTFDAQYSGIRIWQCGVGLRLKSGPSTVTNFYVWGGDKQSDRHTVGIKGDGARVFASTVYLDTCASGFQMQTGSIKCSGLYVACSNAAMPSGVTPTVLDITSQVAVNIKSAQFTASTGRTCKVSASTFNGYLDSQNIDWDRYTDWPHYLNSRNKYLAGSWYYAATDVKIPKGQAIPVLTIDNGIAATCLFDLRNSYGEYYWKECRFIPGNETVHTYAADSIIGTWLTVQLDTSSETTTRVWVANSAGTGDWNGNIYVKFDSTPLGVQCAVINPNGSTPVAIPAYLKPFSARK